MLPRALSSKPFQEEELSGRAGSLIFATPDTQLFSHLATNDWGALQEGVCPFTAQLRCFTGSSCSLLPLQLAAHSSNAETKRLRRPTGLLSLTWLAAVCYRLSRSTAWKEGLYFQSAHRTLCAVVFPSLPTRGIECFEAHQVVCTMWYSSRGSDVI